MRDAKYTVDTDGEDILGFAIARCKSLLMYSMSMAAEVYEILTFTGNIATTSQRSADGLAIFRERNCATISRLARANYKTYRERERLWPWLVPQFRSSLQGDDVVTEKRGCSTPGNAGNHTHSSVCGLECGV